ncbi:RE2, partial [Symbiodinium microadriaticum]
MPGGVFVTRSVRRFGDGFDADLAASFDVCVWEHGLSSIGGKLVLGRKKPAPPVAMPVPAHEGVMPPDIPADPKHDEVHSPSQAAGTDSPAVTNPEYSPSFSPRSQSSKSPSASVSKHASDAAMQQTDASASAEAGSPVAPVPVVVEDSLGLSENPRPAKAARTTEVVVPDEGDHDMSSSGQVSLVTTAGYVLDDNRADEVLVISGDETPCVAHVMQVSYEHEDESVPLTFDGETLEELEDYDESFLDDQVGDSELLPELCLPRTSEIEPCLSQDELASLDEIADAVEIDRLKKMSVLLPEEAASGEQYAGQSPTKLTTRMVRTWREKTVGDEAVWYRRSRYVAREYAWLSVRHDLFAPASTAVSNRLLPIHFLSHEQDANDPWIMASMDISDAYLSVLQTRLVIVQHAGVSYVLGRVLPGQRDRSKAWYEDFSSFLAEELGFEKCTALPSLIRESTTQFAMQLHVDDMLGVGRDSISFLKRHHKLLPGGKMLLTPSAKHFEKLFTVMKIDERSAPKKTPYASVLDEVDHSALLSADEAKAFRCAIGILLYLAVDLIECQGAIRALSSYMSSPTRNAQTALKHLLKYLLDGQHHGLLLCRDNIHCGRSGELSPSTSRAMCIESYSDADWATQLVAFLADCDPPQVHHFTDATAAKSMMERSGVGRVRHLSVRVLWTQQLVADKVISLHKVDTCRNVADLNTKALPRHRMMMLLNLLGGWDTLRDEPIGLNDIAEFEYKQAMKQAVRAVRTTTSGAVNKQVLQGIVLAVASALSRATDVSDEDGDSSDQDVELPQWANRILVWVLGLWVRDDSGVSIIDMLTSHAAPIFCMCILMLLVAMCFRWWCARPPSRQVQVQVSDQRQHGAVSVRFDQNLNVQVGVAAPGTPANPLAVDSDDNAASPPHVLHAMRKGARSKASARLQLPVGWSIPRMQCGSAHMVGATIDCDASSLMGAIASDDFLLQMPLQKVTDHARNVHLE